jgi:hypothetical protein
MEEDIVPPDHSFELPPPPFNVLLGKAPSENSKAASWLHSIPDSSLQAHTQDTVHSMQHTPHSGSPSPTARSAGHGNTSPAEIEATMHESLMVSNQSHQSPQTPGRNPPSLGVSATGSPATDLLPLKVIAQRSDSKPRRASRTPNSTAPTVLPHSQRIVRCAAYFIFAPTHQLFIRCQCPVLGVKKFPKW